jgi:hypothetical protein
MRKKERKRMSKKKVAKLAVVSCPSGKEKSSPG